MKLSLNEQFRRTFRFIKNVYRFRSTLWNSTPWDYQGMFYAMRDQINSQLAYGFPHIMTSKQYEKDLKIVRELLTRLIEETSDDKLEYSDLKFEENEDCTKTVVLESWKKYDLPTKAFVMSKENNYRKADLDMLCNIINRKVFHWWD